jgi:hypothetical protein
MSYDIFDISSFHKRSDLLEESEFIFIVKSQNQIQRRMNMLAARKNGRYGRFEQRPVDTGLFCRGCLRDSRLEIQSLREYREPRHVCRYDNNTFLLTEMSSLLFVDTEGIERHRINNPYFSFLHTVDISFDRQHALIASPGYDVILEINLETEICSYSWFAWEHGFNPSVEGNWLAVNKNYHEKYLKEGKKTLFIDPLKYGEKGIHTAHRTVHPHIARYNPYDNGESIIIVFGHQGEIYQIDRRSNKESKLFEIGSQMPHGLMPYKDGWCITDTTNGEFVVLDKTFSILEKYIVNKLGGKVEGTEDAEWVQFALPIKDQYILFVDANRGILAVDCKQKQYSIYSPDPNWCIQDVICL